MANTVYSLGKVIDFGKHKGKILKDVIDSEPSYVEWLKNNAKNNFVMDNESKNYLIDKMVINSLKYIKTKIAKKYGGY